MVDVRLIRRQALRRSVEAAVNLAARRAYLLQRRPSRDAPERFVVLHLPICTCSGVGPHVHHDIFGTVNTLENVLQQVCVVNPKRLLRPWARRSN